MENEEKKPEEVETSEEIVVNPNAIPHSVTLKKDVSELLATSGPKIRDLVVNELVEAEIGKRKSAVLSLLNKIDEKYKELKKAENQGDVKFDLTGKPVGSPTFTKPQLEEIKKAKEAVAKMQNALDKAFTNGDFSKLLELSGK